ncbi:MAG TPA: hypothetical protein VJA21_25465 [Verrucomicrobiae bacterium]
MGSLAANSWIEVNVKYIHAATTVMMPNFFTRSFWPNAELSRSRRRLGPDEAQEQQTSKHNRKQKGRRLSAPAKG